MSHLIIHWQFAIQMGPSHGLLSRSMAQAVSHQPITAEARPGFDLRPVDVEFVD